jgi:mycothiol synthase
MSDNKKTDIGNSHFQASDLSFRGVEGKNDYPLLLEIFQKSRQADHQEEVTTLENIAESYKPSDTFDPARDAFIAFLTKNKTAVGYSRLGWYSSSKDTKLFYQISHLKPEYRDALGSNPDRGIWQMMVRNNERRLLEMANEHPSPHRYLQAWASDYQRDWIEVLESLDYKVVRRFNNMLIQLDSIPNIPLPPRFEIRPVKPEHMHCIWEAQKEMNVGMFENVEEDWMEEKYQAWLDEPSHIPRYWQVAWEGSQLAGMVLSRIDEKENQQKNRKHAYTEHIFVRPQWRKQGLASALISQSLAVLRENGMHESELGVDSENESSAFRLYENIGFKTFYIDIWFRKNIE